VPKITFLLAEGACQTIDAPAGASLMRAAVTQGIDGIDGECGGSLACGTCHVYVEQGLNDFPPPASAEEEMLGAIMGERRPNSRLSCQLTLKAEHDCVVVRVPIVQG
jgi:2Fe-2S ferredoxin